MGNTPGKAAIGWDLTQIRYSFPSILGKITAFSHLHISFLEDQGSWIYYPKELIVETSTDGMNSNATNRIMHIREWLLAKEVQSKVIRVTVINDSKIPQGKPGAGNTPWTFIDEIMIY